MRKDNPAVYECPKTASGIHTWIIRDDGTSYCLKCDKELSKADTDDMRYDGSRR